MDRLPRIDINAVISDRKEVSVSFLLLLYGNACCYKAWFYDDLCKEKPDLLNNRQLRIIPELRESLEKAIDKSTSEEQKEELKRKLRADPKSIYSRYKSSIGVYRKADETLQRVRKISSKGPKKVQVSRNEMIDRLEGDKERVHSLVLEAFDRLNELLHTFNTRIPRFMTFTEYVEFDTMSYICDEVLKLIPEDLRFPIIDNFLTRSNLAGVEGGVPVIPTSPEFFGCDDFTKVIETFHTRVYPTSTSEAQRGEATWIMPESVRREAEAVAVLSALNQAGLGHEAAQGMFETDEINSKSSKLPLCRVCKTNEAGMRCCPTNKYCSRECACQDWPNHKYDCTNPRRRTQNPGLDLEGAKTNEVVVIHEETSPLSEPVVSSDLESQRISILHELQQLDSEEDVVARAIAALMDDTGGVSISVLKSDDHEDAGCEPRPALDAIKGMKVSIQRLSGSQMASVETTPLCSFCGASGKLKRCCENTRYCDSACQRSDWKRHVQDCQNSKHMREEKSYEDVS
jgi:hypothetical protein